MKKNLNLLSLSAVVLLFFLFTLSNCSKSSDPAPVTTGKISGKVTDLGTAGALADATVIVFDASNNSPVNTAKTNSTGDYSFDVVPGNYFLKFSKQGYLSIPAVGTSPVSFVVTLGATTDKPAQLSASTVINAGYISGKVSVGATGQPGVLVAAEATGVAFSAISDKDGNYTIFNVPAASYQVKGYLASYSTASVAAAVVANTQTPNINVSLTLGAAGQFSGTFKVISQTTIATPPTTMDIALVHPITKETIPGLSQSVAYSSSLSYSFTKVPDGSYVIRASYANDYIVIDPDYVTKFGDYKVTLAAGVPTPATVDIVATSAVILTSPTNAMTTIVPVDATTTPTFQWSSYSSTSDYVIEVADASTGIVVWGGFTNTNGTITKKITIPSSTTSITYNSDSKASQAALTVGKVYRWRIFASKNNNQTNSWNLIAASEDQMGLIKVK
jgi:hypothetical protein